MPISGLGAAATGIGPRPFDSVDMMDGLEQGIRPLAEMDPTDRVRIFRYLSRLTGMSPTDLQKILGASKHAETSRGFLPRLRAGGSHLDKLRTTYPQSAEVSRRSVIGRRFGFMLGALSIVGRHTGRNYQGSFAKPAAMDGGSWYFQGRSYGDLHSLEAEVSRGRPGGENPLTMTVLGQARNSFIGRLPALLAGRPMGGQGSTELMQAIYSQPGGMFSGIPSGAPVPQGSDASAILSSGGSLEDKMLLFGANASSTLDSEIEALMAKIEAASSAKTGGGTGAGGVGSAHGGPIGGTVGTSHAENAAAGGVGVPGAGGSSVGSSNIQLMQTQLQILMQRRQQLFQLMTNIMKSLHDASMTAIRNMKA